MSSAKGKRPAASSPEARGGISARRPSASKISPAKRSRPKAKGLETLEDDPVQASMEVADDPLAAALARVVALETAARAAEATEANTNITIASLRQLLAAGTASSLGAASSDEASEGSAVFPGKLPTLPPNAILIDVDNSESCCAACC